AIAHAPEALLHPSRGAARFASWILTKSQPFVHALPKQLRNTKPLPTRTYSGPAKLSGVAKCQSPIRTGYGRVVSIGNWKLATGNSFYLVTFAVCEPCFLNTRVGENSPSL